MEKVAKKCIFRKAGYAIRTRLCSPNTLFRFRASAGKVIQQASQKLAKIVQNPSKNAFRDRARIHAQRAGTQNAENAKKCRKRVLQMDTKNVTFSFFGAFFWYYVCQLFSLQTMSNYYASSIEVLTGLEPVKNAHACTQILKFPTIWLKK